jgi:hypothetical protein
MTTKLVKRLLSLITFTVVSTGIFAQNKVPLGIHYQAVARDNFGNELANKKISVKFSIISEDPLSAPVYQEVHQDVITSKFGVFSIVIGHGILTGNGTCTSLSEIAWENANHYLKVEVKFENTFMDMGTMQFLAVPYALYAQKSLEPGPEGPKGDKGDQGLPGDPASDDQILSVVNIDGSDYLAISGGNQVKISSIEKDGDPTNELQDLIYNSSTHVLQLTKSTLSPIDLSELKNDADPDPSNEIQDLQLISNKLSITGKTGAREINMNNYLDNTDDQQLTYTESNNTLSIEGGNSVTLGTMVAFRAKNTATDISAIASYPTMTYDDVYYNVGNYLNPSTGIFTAPFDGIYTFNVAYFADGTGDGREIAIYVNSVLYEKLAISISAGSTVPVRSVTMRLSATNTVSVVIYTGLATQTGTGTFSGFKVF